MTSLRNLLKRLRHNWIDRIPTQAWEAVWFILVIIAVLMAVFVRPEGCGR